MIKFNKCKLNSQLLDQWVKTNVNVLLIGEKGVGKSHQIIDTFNRNNLKYAYFSGATLDPWIHLLGIPKAKQQEDGSEKMEFILPENLDNNVEAIFCDEWNRTNKVVRNALLELQQFKSINGRKFPNLRMVWGAVNPPKTDEEDSADYDVDELDPAQLDRFHIVVELPNEPDLVYFKNKFGNFHGKVLVDWWKQQSKESLKILSPRRLEYVGECFRKGLDVKYLLPISANVKELVKKLSLDEKEELIRQLLEKPTDDEMKEFLSDDSNFLKYKSVLQKPKFWQFWQHINKEFVAEEIKTSLEFENYTIYQVMNKNPFYTSLVVDIAKANPSNVIVKIIKSLKDQKYDATQDAISQFVSSEANFSTLKETNNAKDVFSNDTYHWRNINIKTYCPLDPVYQLQTNERRRLMEVLATCWSKTSPIHAINFMMSNLLSMQKATISKQKNFIALFGTICKLAKEHLPDEAKIAMVNHIKTNSNKLSINRIEDYTNYMTNSADVISSLPSSFLQKVKNIRSVLNISNTEDDSILSLLDL